MRSYLFVPGDSERKLQKAMSTQADALILDLEDSVSLPRKEAARAIVADFLSDCREGRRRPQLIVRVNALSTGLTDADLAGVIGAAPDAVLLPKSSGGADVQHLAVLLAVHEADSRPRAGDDRHPCPRDGNRARRLRCRHLCGKDRPSADAFLGRRRSRGRHRRLEQQERKAGIRMSSVWPAA